MQRRPNHVFYKKFWNYYKATWFKSYCSLFKVLKRCLRKKQNKSWIQLFQPLKKTIQNCLKGQYGSNHIVLASPNLGFRKSGKCWIFKDVMVQLRTIRFTVFKWTIWFIRTIRFGNYYCPSRRLKILYVVVTRTLICD